MSEELIAEMFSNPEITKGDYFHKLKNKELIAQNTLTEILENPQNFEGRHEFTTLSRVEAGLSIIKKTKSAETRINALNTIKEIYKNTNPKYFLQRHIKDSCFQNFNSILTEIASNTKDSGLVSELLHSTENKKTKYDILVRSKSYKQLEGFIEGINIDDVLEEHTLENAGKEFALIDLIVNIATPEKIAENYELKRLCTHIFDNAKKEAKTENSEKNISKDERWHAFTQYLEYYPESIEAIKGEENLLKYYYQKGDHRIGYLRKALQIAYRLDTKYSVKEIREKITKTALKEPMSLRDKNCKYAIVNAKNLGDLESSRTLLTRGIQSNKPYVHEIIPKNPEKLKTYGLNNEDIQMAVNTVYKEFEKILEFKKAKEFAKRINDVENIKRYSVLYNSIK